MTRQKVGSNAAHSDSIANRAATFLAVNHAGPHSTKRIAQLFGISAGMAKLLRAGRGWTVARLDQATALFGNAFKDFVWPPSPDELHDRLDRIDAVLEEIRRDLRGEK